MAIKICTQCQNVICETEKYTIYNGSLMHFSCFQELKGQEKNSVIHNCKYCKHYRIHTQMKFNRLVSNNFCLKTKIIFNCENPTDNYCKSKNNGISLFELE